MIRLRMLILIAAAAVAAVAAGAPGRAAELSFDAETYRSEGRAGADGYFAVNISGAIAESGKSAKLSFKEGEAYLTYRRRLGTQKLRFVGRLAADWPRAFTITVKGQDDIVLSGVSAAQADGALAREWSERRASYLAGLAERMGGNSFLAYQATWTAARAGLKAPPIHGTRGPGRSSWELIEMTSRELAFGASLESGAASGRSSYAGPKSFRIKADSLRRPVIPDINYAALADIDGVKLPKPFDMVPARCAALRMKSISKALQVSDLTTSLTALALEATGWAPRRPGFSDLARQLGFEASVSLRAVYPLAVGDVTAVFGDFYFPEGAEYGLILKIENAKLFDNRIQASRRAIAGRLEGTTTEVIRHAGVDIEHIRSPDESLRSYYFSLGDYAAFANTLSLAREIIDASRGDAGSLADAADAKSLWVTTRGGRHDAFAVMPEAFIRRLTAAPSKVSELRRIRCGAEMELLGCARALASLRGMSPETPAALTEAGMLAREPLCPEGGQFTFDGTTQWYRCSLHKVQGSLERVSERLADKVSPDESRRYTEFVRDFSERIWGRGACATAATIDVGRNVVIRATVPDLPEGGAVDTVQGLFGGDPIDLRLEGELAPGAVAGFALKLNPFHSYRSDLSNVHPESFRSSMKAFRDRVQGHLGWRKENHILSWADDTAHYSLLDQEGMPNLRTADGVLRVPMRDRDAAVESIAQLQWLGAHIGIGRMPKAKFKAGTAEAPVITSFPSVKTKGLAYHVGFGSRAAYFGTRKSLVAAAIESERSGAHARFTESAKRLVAELPRRANVLAVVDTSRCERLRQAILRAAEKDAALLCRARREFIDDLRELRLLGPSGRSDEPTIEDDLELSGEGPAIRCPDGGKYSRQDAGQTACSIHDDPSFGGGLPPASAPSMALADTLKAVAISLEFHNGGGTLTIATPNPDYRLRPFDWAFEKLGWGAVAIVAAGVLLALYAALKILRRLRRRPHASGDASDTPQGPADQ